MICAEDLCLRLELVVFDKPPEEIKIESRGAVAICVKPQAVAHWLELAQALYYAYHWKGPAKNPNISALVFLAKTSQIRDALAYSAAGAAEAICAALGPRDAVEAVEMPRGRPHMPTGSWDPWAITKFALDLVK